LKLQSECLQQFENQTQLAVKFCNMTVLQIPLTAVLGSVLNVELEVDSPSSPEGLHNVPDYSTDTSML
jgi:hypothetical protein